MKNWSRRDFLKTASAATLATLAAGYPRQLLADGPATAPDPSHNLKPTADAVIVLWMAGGMAHTETFDPKRYTAFEKGLESKRVLSTFPAIDTAVDNIKISQGLENIAKVMDRATLIRSYQAGDLGFILHSRHQFHWHTGYAPPQTVHCPHIGGVMSRTLGPRESAMPAFIDIGQRPDVGAAETEELKAFRTAGFLGSEYGPFLIPEPAEAMKSISPPKGMDMSRFENRNALYKKLLAESPVGEFGSDFQKESLLRSMDNAHRLLTSPAAKAFDLTLEPKKSYEKYNTGRFGLGCLLARRLVESGARYIEVTSEYIPFKYWDTHDNGHERMIELKKMIDQPVAQLVLDLEERGLLDRTLIVLASEFSRDMMMEGRPDSVVKDQVVVPDVITEPAHYGMHRHFTDGCSVLMFGGGMKKGFLYGKTADERPCKTIEGRITIEDLHATIFRAVGISPKLSYEVEKRPFYVTRDGVGVPRAELFGKPI
ncbi:MAG: hypothetical protein QOF78_776 [Phycisphaerales bacterium]|jgi:hypothetical protein|nr:hypothetical protein [Phycisphaerales bacterium]